jgi:Laminin G domain/EGF-like domain
MPSQHFISLQVLNESVFIQHDLTSYSGVSSISSFPVTVSDGRWHSIVVNLSPVNATLLVDQHVVTSADKADSSLLVGLFNNSFNVTVGRSSLNGFYKGCLSSVEIGGLLLPLTEVFKNDTVVNQFTVVDKQDVTDGCHSDDVCDLAVCANNGTCVDMWNSFVCHCPVGYNGTNCELNVDDCAAAGMGCQNGGTCIDGVASYSCVCPVGFTGFRYVRGRHAYYYYYYTGVKRAAVN